MRPMAIVLCCCAPLAWTRPGLAQEPPYEAVVVDDNVVARSGPGRQYYPTSKLPRGTKVRVLRHDYGGWYAVSPPEGSFSWVDSRHVEDQGGGVGVVKADNVVVRIGSSAVSASDMLAGVQLSSNQKVRILDSAVLDAKSGARYYKIESVRGEERWIAGRSLAPADAEPVSGPTLSPADGPQDPRWSNASRQTRDPEPTGQSAPATHAPRSQRDAVAEDATVQQQPDDESAVDDGPALHGTPRDEPSLDDEPDPEPLLPDPDPALSVLHDAHRRLAEIVSQDLAAWELEPARELYRRALLQARSPHIRFAARQGLDRVDRYAALKDNYDGFQRAKARAETAARIAQDSGGRTTASRDDGRNRSVGLVAQTRWRRSDPGETQAPEVRHATDSGDLPLAHDSAAAPLAENGLRLIAPLQTGPQPHPLPPAITEVVPQHRAEPAPPRAAAQQADLSSPQQPETRREAASTVPPRRPAALVTRLDDVPNRRVPVARPAAAETAAVVGTGTPSAGRAAERVGALNERAPVAASQTDGPPSIPSPDHAGVEGRYDGSGTLLRTAMQGFRAPEYKLADSTGRVRFYVSPALGTDLRPYLHQSVAVVGQIQYRADLRAHHITVRQVIRLSVSSDAAQQAALPVSTRTPSRRYY